MHDCRQTQAQLTDLAFDELSPAAREHVWAETAGCAACQAEYLALATLLRACDQARTTAQPAEEFWPGYHARLKERLAALDREPSGAQVSHAGAWHWSTLSSLRRALTATLRVPVPVALAAALALVVLSALVLRPAPARVISAAPAMEMSPAPVRAVEVPVVKEKIVTRTVYVTRNGSSRWRRATQTRSDDLRLARRKKDAESEQAAREALAGFQPAGDVKLRVIKGSFTHEQ